MQMSLSGLAALIREEGHFNGKSALVTKIRHCQWLQVQIRTLGPRSWNRGHFHGLFLANFGPRTSFPAGSFEISPASPLLRPTRPLILVFFRDLLELAEERERGGDGRSVCVWSLGSGDAVAAAAVYCAAPTISATAEISPRIDRPRPTAANRKASPLSSPTALLAMWVRWKARSSDLTLVVHAANHRAQIS